MTDSTVTDGDRLSSRLNPDERSTSGSTRDARSAHAREETTPANPESIDTVRARLAAWMRRELRPPELWTDQPPSLRQLWLYARHGQQAGKDGMGRAVCLLSGLLSLPLCAAAAAAHWVGQRPLSRPPVVFAAWAATAQVPVLQVLMLTPDWLRL